MRVRAAVVFSLVLVAACRGSTLPRSLGDAEFWTLSESLSEPEGTFSLSDNLVSNEPRLAENARWIQSRGGVYVGVGPEQNFTYIARLRPDTAFIVDIRRDNRNLHLLYKALFELSDTRVEFVSRLFSRAWLGTANRSMTARELFDQIAAAPRSAELRDRTKVEVHERLTKARGFPLSAGDLASIDRALQAFFSEGPGINYYWSAPGSPDSVRPTYRQLMTGIDLTAQERRYLADEASFAFVKQLQVRNLIVPLVGDFAGPRTIRAVGRYARDHGSLVRAFYGSNVGIYLNSRQMRAFCASLDSLPAAPGAWFIESDGVRSFDSKLKTCQP